MKSDYTVLEQEKLIGLLLGCLHLAAERVSAADLTGLGEAEWEAFLALATEQRIRPLLYQRLNERGLDAVVPDRVMAALRAVYRQTALRTMRFQAELAALAQALAAQDVPLLALKGIWLARAVYANPALREMNDVDVLVHREHLPAALDVLTQRGYTPSQEVDIEVNTATMHHLPRFLKADVAGFEIHWSLCRLNRSYSINTDELWERVVPAQIGRVSLLGLAPEDLLLHLCLHTSYQHQFVFGLRPSCDIAAVIERYGIALDWAVVCERARRWRWQRGVYLALRLAADLVGAAVPEDVMAALQPVILDEAILATARQQIFTQKAFSTQTTSRAIALRLQPGILPKLLYARRQLFPPQAALRLLYGRSAIPDWIPLYYATHIGKFIQRYSRTVWNTVTRDRSTLELLERKNVVHEWLSDI